MTADEAIVLARASLRKRIAAREENFLNLAEKGIFNYPRSPFLQLLASRKVGIQELRAWVAKDGLEGTLRTLQTEGVYFTVDEFKGKTPVRRNGASFTCEEAMFDNPFLSFVYEVRSGATRSAGTRFASTSTICISGRSTTRYCSNFMVASLRRWRTGSRCFRARRESTPACVSRTSATPCRDGFRRSLRTAEYGLGKTHWDEDGLLHASAVWFAAGGAGIRRASTTPRLPLGGRDARSSTAVARFTPSRLRPCASA